MDANAITVHISGESQGLVAALNDGTAALVSFFGNLSRLAQTRVQLTSIKRQSPLYRKSQILFIYGKNTNSFRPRPF